MVTTPLTPTTKLIHLSGISWRTYETLLDELSDRHFHLTDYRGNLEIMAPFPEHEFSKKVMGHFVETLAEELSKDCRCQLC
jgi:Uma2 family endonuclease